MSNRISIAVIGAGNNSRNTHLPILQELRDRKTFQLSIICDINDSLAESVRAEFGFDECTPNAEVIFDRDEVETISQFSMLIPPRTIHEALTAWPRADCARPVGSRQRDFFIGTTASSFSPIGFQGPLERRKGAQDLRKLSRDRVSLRVANAQTSDYPPTTTS